MHVTDELEPLFAHLARSLHTSSPNAVVQPIEVASISARWAPYAQVRGALGIATNEDYEVLLMRLLAGEGGYIFADESLQDDLRREVSSPNPDLTALRTYGAARVTLAREQVRRVLRITAESLPATPIETPSRVPPKNAPLVGDPTAAMPAPRAAQVPACQYCGHALPTGRTVLFCPHCGLNVDRRLCPGCSSEVQADWRFCITCGRAVAGTQKRNE
jgi:hypothetical protein